MTTTPAQPEHAETMPEIIWCGKPYSGSIDGSVNYPGAKAKYTSYTLTSTVTAQLTAAKKFEEKVSKLIKEEWLKLKPSEEAQDIRAAIKVDSGKNEHQPEADFLPDYVWDIADIAAQMAINAAKMRERELMECIRDLALAFDATGQKHAYRNKHAAIIKQATDALGEGK